MGNSQKQPREGFGEILAEAHKHQAERLARRKEAYEQSAGQRRRRLLTARSLIYLLPLLLLLTLVNLLSARRAETPFTPHEELVAARSLVYLTASAVEAYHASEGQWPRDLAQIQYEDDQVLYSRFDDTYSLTVQTDSHVVTYHQGEELEPYREDWVQLCRGINP